jgi:serine/threonine protein kinase
LSDLVIGSSIASYELVSLIGRTGMSEVWKARDWNGNIVALKTISQQAGEDPQLRARFLREGAEHQLLQHPSIVPILDFFELEGNCYLVMEYLAGGSLEDRLESNNWGPLPIPEALKISRQVLPALDYAHQRLIIHRDVKPSNILLNNDRAYLGDFGIALVLGRPRLTVVAQVLGTRCYMSPEQIATPMNVTHLTDVYSFGCVLYEMLTGRQPYDFGDETDEGNFEKLIKRLREPPVPPRQWNPEIPARLERIVLTSLASEPADRFRGCGSFARALEGFEQDSTRPIVVVPVPETVAPSIVPNTPAFVPAKPDPVKPPVPSTSAEGPPTSAVPSVLTALLIGAMWLAFYVQASEGAGALAFLCWGGSNALLLWLLYKAWAALPAAHATTLPGKAVVGLLVPIYNLIWCWKAFPGLNDGYIQYMKRSGKPVQTTSLYIQFCIFHFYLPLLALISESRVLIGLALSLDLIVYVPVMIGSLANRIQQMAVAAQKVSPNSAGTEHAVR